MQSVIKNTTLVIIVSLDKYEKLAHRNNLQQENKTLRTGAGSLIPFILYYGLVCLSKSLFKAMLMFSQSRMRFGVQLLVLISATENQIFFMFSITHSEILTCCGFTPPTHLKCLTYNTATAKL